VRTTGSSWRLSGTVGTSTTVTFRPEGTHRSERIVTLIDWYEQNREWYEPLVLAS
jgi:hypothetical protein